MSTSKDIVPLQKRPGKVTVTPHRIGISVLIKEFFKLRDNEPNIIVPKRHVRDFCLLVHKLMQSPDGTLSDIQRLLSSGNYTMYNQLILKFNETLTEINNEGPGCLLNFISELGKLIMRDSDVVNDITHVQIHKNSIVGYYIRRLLINFDKLTYSEVTMVFSAYQLYYATRRNIENYYAPYEETAEIRKLLNKERWPRRQAEFFIAHQALLLGGNVEKAVNPKDLRNQIKNLLKSNPDLAEGHFLNYLNCLRVKEFCAAINSLYHCFDRSGSTEAKGSVDQKSKSFRFAALNLAILHAHFGRREDALAALKEAIMLAQEANDNVCLQHALSWLYCLSNSNKDKLLEHSILKSLDLNLTYLVSLGIQSFVQYAGISGGTPKYIFETITRSDMVNCQHTYGDLTCKSYAQKAAMWLFYGKTEMSSLWSQLLLHLNSENNSLGKAYFGESLCQAMCNVANHFLQQGEYTKGLSIINLARSRFPSEPISHIWMLCECIFTFVRALHLEKWADAESAAQKMAVYDKWESHLSMAELYIKKGDFEYALKCVSDILDNRNQASGQLRIDYHMRTMILLGEVQYISSYPNVVPPTPLNICVAYANDFHVDYLGAIVYLHLANVQLLMGMPAQALKLLDRCLLHILTHGGCYDRARAVFLYAKCLISNASYVSDKERGQVLLEATNMLHDVCWGFAKVDAFSRVKEVLYLQAVLYNEMNFIKERNKCSLEYRILNEEHPSNNTTTLSTHL